MKDPTLIGKPVIVGATGTRGVVSSCSYEARKMGVRSAMAGFKARALCPDGIFVSGNMSDYSHYSRLVTNLIIAEMPVVEKASIDEFYIDLSGTDRFFKPFDLLLQLKTRIKKDIGLPISFALGPNKLVTKIATNEVKPNGQIAIPSGAAAAYLAPLGIGKMPGLGAKTESFLNAKGIHLIGDLAKTDPYLLESWLGKSGADLHRKSMGIDNSSIVTEHEQKSISAEETFRDDITEIDFLEKELVRLTEKVAQTLRRKGKLAGCVGIKLRYHNFETVQHQQVLAYTASDSIIIRQARHLLKSLLNPHRPVRLLGIKLSQFVPAGSQLVLFDVDEEGNKLLNAIDHINLKMGSGTVKRAGGINVKKDKDGPLWHTRSGLDPD